MAPTGTGWRYTPDLEPPPKPARPRWREDIEAVEALVFGSRSREEIYDEIGERMARILNGPEMEQVDHANGIEVWAADLTLSGIPRSNAVMSAASSLAVW